ncbi:hypothetical protein KKG31_02450 [Patescibacteria group bacterium]|nr:hypothetical protein [Patescibacteria group bacterium]MBU1758027.1 hypothetical protein [Patescibacteria group bacterium]
MVGNRKKILTKKRKEMERAVKDVFCPWCGQTLVRKYNTRLTINGKPTDRVLLFKIIRWNGERGELELSLTPGDYHKYSTLNLNPEEELTFIHAHNGDVNVYADRGCHKRMNEGMFVKILVQFEDSPDIYEYYIVAKNGIEQTLYNIHPQYIIKEDGLFYKKNALQKREFECVPQGRTYKDIGEYLKQQIKSISQR